MVYRSFPAAWPASSSSQAVDRFISDVSLYQSRAALAESGQLFLCFNGRRAKSRYRVFFFFSFSEPSSLGQLVMLIPQSPDLTQL